MLRKKYAIALGTTLATTIALSALTYKARTARTLRDSLRGTESIPMVFPPQGVGNAPSEIQVKVLNKEIFVVDASGQMRQLTHDGKPKEHATLSPAKDRVIYHGHFDPYKSPPEPVILTVLDLETGNLVQQVSVNWSARFVTDVKWVKDYLVLVQGEGSFLAVVNLRLGKQTHQLVGSDFSLSPDGAIIIFHHDFNPRYGAVPPQFDSDYVLLSLTERESSSGLPGENFRIIYPDLLGWGEVERKNFRDLKDRHHIKNAFFWSPDSRSIAFTETHQQKCFLVVLGLDRVNEDVAIRRITFEVGPADTSIDDLSWMPDGKVIKMRANDTDRFFDSGVGKVQPSH